MRLSVCQTEINVGSQICLSEEMKRLHSAEAMLDWKTFCLLSSHSNVP